MSCRIPTLKYLLFILNILCSIFSVLQVLACVYSLTEYHTSEVIEIPCKLGIVLGAILFVFSILGCCGVFYKSIHLIWMYAMTMLLLLVGHVTVILLQPVDFAEISREIISDVWHSETNIDYQMTLYEMKYKCCGKFGPSDYMKADLLIPQSCYLNNDNTTRTNIFNVGCILKLTMIFADNQAIEDLSDWTLVGLEASSALVAVILAISLKNNQRRKLYN